MRIQYVHWHTPDGPTWLDHQLVQVGTLVSVQPLKAPLVVAVMEKVVFCAAAVEQPTVLSEKHAASFANVAGGPTFRAAAKAGYPSAVGYPLPGLL